MMTVLEHMKAAGYDPAKAWNAASLTGHGTMECESVSLRTWKCRPDAYGDLMVAVEAVARVPCTDGTLAPYPSGWSHSMEARAVAYFPCDDRG